jgi:putative addiction module component (TIGR02574 family)
VLDEFEDSTMSQSSPGIDIQHLDPTQKLDLITQLWDSLPNSTESMPIPEWHRQELEQRLAAADASPGKAIPWEDVRKRLRETS